MKNRYNKKKKIVILGAGFGGVYTFKYLHKALHHREDIELILVDRNNFFLFTPLLHEVATGGVSPENIVQPLRKVLGCSETQFYLSEINKVHLNDKKIDTTLGIIDYDYLVLSMGAQTNYFNTPGAEEYSFALKTLDDAVKLKNHFIKNIEAATKVEDEETKKKLLRFVVIGGGATGVETAAEISEFCYGTFKKYYDHDISKSIEIILVNRGEEILGPAFPERFRKRGIKVLNDKKVDVRLGAGVVEIGKDYVKLDNGEKIETATSIWVAGVKPSECPCDVEIQKDKGGRYLVNQSLQLIDYPEVFVLGDLAGFVNKGEERPIPMLAQAASMQAVTVAKNVKRLIEGDSLKEFNFKPRGMMISLGHWQALAQIGKIYFQGSFAWWFWRTIYLSKLISLRKKVRVAIDWTMNLFAARDISEIS